MPRIESPTSRAIELAAEALRAGNVVAVPTETVYGLAADAMNEVAVRTIFQLKNRPPANPLIVHVLNAQQAQRLVTQWDKHCERLASMFWPGPLTLVLPKAEGVPDVVTAGYETVAVRAPAHEVMRALLKAFGGPLAAPSANRSTSISPTTAAHVAEDFKSVDDLLILDGGPCTVGIESTVLDLAGKTPTVLRPGGISIEQLREAIGDINVRSHRAQAKSPGTSPRHYAPRTPCELVSHDELTKKLEAADHQYAVVCFDPAMASRAHAVIVMPASADRYASMIYDALRRMDATGAERILIERPAHSEGLWTAILDRLQRATARP